MYVRVTPGKPRRDGTRTDYVQLAHNVWDPERKRSQVQVIHSFGRADTLDVAGLRRLAESIGRFLDRGEAGPAALPPSDGLRLLGSRPMGAGWLLDGLWSRLGFAEAIG
ncbi:MAG: hypothetical protein WCF04_00250, partial [Candidatus Nanopelagicales bacterium]